MQAARPLLFKVCITGFGDSNLEVVFQESDSNLVHWSHNNSDLSSPWIFQAIFSNKATGPGSIKQTGYHNGQVPGNLEVYVLEGNNLQHYYRGILNNIIEACKNSG